MRRPLRVLISAGPTREPIDPVRFLSNYSTGFMGFCLASEAIRRGHRVTLVSGPTTFLPPQGVRVIWVEQARQMQDVLRRQMAKADVLLMAAAVCDFEPVRPAREKLSRQKRRTLLLKATPDILGNLPRRRGQVIVGFALDTNQTLTHAREKLAAKRLDFIVGQQLNGINRPFGNRPVKAFFLDASGKPMQLGRISKTALARALLDKIEGLWYGEPTSKVSLKRLRYRSSFRQASKKGASSKIDA